MAASPRSDCSAQRQKSDKHQSRAVGESDPGGAHRAHPEVRLEKLPHILATIVTAVPDSRRFREAASAMGDLLDVAEGGVAVEPGEPAGGRNPQQEDPARTQDAGRFGQRLLLEHRQRQLIEQNNRVVRSVRLRPGDDRWHERGGASLLGGPHQRTGVERMPVDLVASAAQCSRQGLVPTQQDDCRSVGRWQVLHQRQSSYRHGPRLSSRHAISAPECDDTG